LLANRVADSAYLLRSSRLRAMFVYVCGRVLDESAEEIHEQEVGQQVFGRPVDYDTAADNTVRVHASMLRKRVNQYFENEGSGETLVIEIPRGNYAPVFRERAIKPQEPEPLPLPQAQPQAVLPSVTAAAPAPSPLWIWLPSLLALIFAATSLGLYLHMRTLAKAASPLKPGTAVAELWSQIFPNGKQTHLVLGDAALGILQEGSDRPIALTQYFDRSYLNSVDSISAASRLDPVLARALILKRQVNYGDVAMLSRLTDMARAVGGEARVQFARDFSFRDLKGDNSVFFGLVSSNPWIEPFLSRQTLQWKYDGLTGTFYPVDTAAKPADPEKFHATTLPDGSHEGFATLDLFPNLSGAGKVLIVSATGGTAMNAAIDFLNDEHSIEELRSQLAPNLPKSAPTPNFEVLIRTSSRNTVPRDASIVIARRVP
jgi:hypothetical protein